MFDKNQRPARVAQWGNPWHGRFEAAGLRLSNGVHKPYFAPMNAPEAYRVAFAGLPAPETPEEQLEQGMEWRADALLYTLEKRYSPAGPLGIGYLSWLWRSAAGVVWRLRLQLAFTGFSVAVGSSTVTGIKVYASQFGVFGGEPSTEHLVLDTSLSWTNRGPSTFFVVPHLSHSPSGARTALTMRTGASGFTSQPDATEFGGRIPMVRAGRGSGLYELVVTGTNEAGLPVVSLQVVVASAAARINASSSTPSPMRSPQSVIFRDGESTTDGDWPEGWQGITSFKNYGQPNASITPPASTASTVEQLVCGAYDAGGALRQVWYKLTSENTFSVAEPGGTTVARFDSERIYRTDPITGITEELSGQRDMPAFELVSIRSQLSKTQHELLLDGVVVATQARETYRHEQYTCSYPGISSSAPYYGPGWSLPEVDFIESRLDYGEVRINGLIVATGTPGIPDQVVTDALRYAWTDAPPRILSNNVFALCPFGVYPPDSTTRSYVEHVVAVDGGIYEPAAPAECGAFGQGAVPAWDPRNGQIHFAVNAINGYV